jgi:hypothetical protein
MQEYLEGPDADPSLLKFTAAEWSGGHCEATARRLFHQRLYDWLDETLG